MPLFISGSNGISGADGTAALPAVQGTDTNTGMYFPAADQIAFAEGGVEAMRLDASGNVGIGVATPTARLHVNGTSGSAQVRMGTSAGYYEVNAFDGNPVYMVVNGTNHTSGVIGTQSNTPFAFFTNNTERARITSGGNFLVGTASTFDVTSGATTQLAGQCAVFAAGSPNTLMSFYNSSQAARVGFIGSSGNSTSYNSGSDYRLKENVTNISAAAAAVHSLRPVTFTWKVSPETGTFSGFIAHELQEVWPEAVVGEKDAICSDGVTPNYQMVDQSKLVPLLTAALQEVLTEIAALKARVAVLEATP